MIVAEVSSLHHTKFLTNQDFFFKNKSINLPIMPSDFGQGSSKIVPRRLSSSKILLSFFSILVYYLFKMIVHPPLNKRYDLLRNKCMF